MQHQPYVGYVAMTVTLIVNLVLWRTSQQYRGMWLILACATLLNGLAQISEGRIPATTQTLLSAFALAVSVISIVVAGRVTWIQIRAHRGSA